MKSELKKAGRINYRALRLARKIIDSGVSALDIVKEIEMYIYDQGGKPAFPVNISINEIAAHFTPIDNSVIIKEGDVVKIDVGVHIDGWISDSAITIEVRDGKYKKLIEASKRALREASKILKKDIEICEIGKIIERTIKSYGFNPIYNLSGHKIEQWNLHAGISIPNFDNKSTKRLEEGVYAIEPFATTGVGFVRDMGESNILQIIRRSIPRDRITRQVYEYIVSEYKTLPFSKRWIIEKFGITKANYTINYLKRLNILKEYPILVEKSKGIVSQFEHTFYIGNEVFTISSE